MRRAVQFACRVYGTIYEIPADRVSGRKFTFIENLPAYDSPIVVTERRLVMPQDGK